MIPNPPDDWLEWYNAEVDPVPTDTRYLVHPAHPRDFERIYEVVDKAFQHQRPRELYDHWYRKHPFGLPRFVYVEEKSTGKILKVGGNFPWPIWKGKKALSGRYSGDAATLPEWQRKGLSQVRREVRHRHPMHGKTCTISGPNRSSRIVTRRSGRGDELLGAMRGGLLSLQADAMSQSTPIKSWIAKATTACTSIVASGVRLSFGVAADPDLRFEPLSRFTTDFDSITLKSMYFDKFWCPHNADFLNWRYIDYPTVKYRAYVLLKGDEVIGYSVLRLNQPQIGLAEFVASPTHAEQLMAHTIHQAQLESGRFISFFSTPAWPHWKLFYRFGMLPVPSSNHLDVGFESDAKDVQNIKHWRLSPGDRDYH